MQLRIPAATENCGWPVQQELWEIYILEKRRDGKINGKRDVRKIGCVCPSIHVHPIQSRTSTSREKPDFR
jgi:hypothetical protein